MRILYVSQLRADDADSSARQRVALVREISRLGQIVTFIAPGAAEAGNAKRVRPPANLRPGVRMELALAALAAREVLIDRPDVALVRMSAASGAVPLGLAALGIPVVLELDPSIMEHAPPVDRPGTEHDVRGPGARRALRTAVASVAEPLLRRIIQRARAVVTYEASVGEHARAALGTTEVHIIPCGADLDSLLPGDRIEARRALGLPVEPRVLALVDTLDPALRLDLLAQAHRRLPGVVLLVAGGGQQRPFLDAMAMATRPSSPVLYLGDVPPDQALRAIRAADICVDARESCDGLASLAYAAVGRRQVALHTEGRDRIAPLYAGLEAVHLAPERSPDALRLAIESAFAAERKLGPLPGTAIAEARLHVGCDRQAAMLVQTLRGLVR